MANAIDAKIKYEIGLIDELIDKTLVLIELVELKKPDFIELNAIGSVLHSFYNGIENIFVLVNKNIDEMPISGDKWHKQLLDSMTENILSRAAVIPESTRDILIEYLAFRHFYRHAYGNTLQWDRMEDIFMGIENTWTLVKNDLIVFLNSR